ncbi:MAG: hypothetical protein LBK64_02925, partial [Spirochaetaceae bacterium]|nr:hypothetical protein [Spirochaetaceae bacterium]
GITGKIGAFSEDMGAISAGALSGGESGGGIRRSLRGALDLAHAMQDSAAELAEQRNSFGPSVPEIQDLSEKTKKGIDEMYSGIRELIEKTEENEKRAGNELALVLRGALEKGEPVPDGLFKTEAPEEPAPSPALAPAGNAETGSADSPHDPRGVAVKQPPKTVV